MKTVTYDETKWQLVPKEPTKEMTLNAGMVYEEDPFGGKAAWPSDVYKSMLAAAPPNT